MATRTIRSLVAAKEGAFVNAHAETKIALIESIDKMQFYCI